MTHTFAILCMIAVAAGLTVCVVMVRWFLEFKTVGDWKSTPGRIIASRVHFTTTGSSEGSPGDARYDIHIQYEYRVGANIYRGRRKALAWPEATFFYERAAEEELKREYTVGQPVEVYYNPRRPKSSALDPRVDNRRLALVFMGGTELVLFPLAALGGLFGKKGSLLASLSTPLLLLTLVVFAAIIYLAIKTPGERLEGSPDPD